MARGIVVQMLGILLLYGTGCAAETEEETALTDGRLEAALAHSNADEAPTVTSSEPAGARPLFQLPFPCGERWRLSTYPEHDDFDIDMFYVDGSSNSRPIVASFDGTVVRAGFDSGGGNYVRIDHGGGWHSLYLHMIETPAVRVGQRVVQGQQIGRVGSTGASSAPHLHYEQLRDGRKVESWFAGVPSGITTDGYPPGEPRSRDVVLTSKNCGSSSLGVLDFHLSDDSTSSQHTRPVIHYGNSPMLPIVGDWDGDGADTVSTYEPNRAQFFLSDNPATGQAQRIVVYGNPAATPLVGDWDGDGKDNIGVRMGNVFYLRMTAITNPAERTVTIAYGDSGDVAVVGDWDGDGIDNVGVYKPAQARFYLRMSAISEPTEATHVVAYGDANVTPLVGDWNRDGRDNIGVRMGNVFYFRTSEVTKAAEITSSVTYGNGSRHEIPVIGDWDGDEIDTQGIVY